MSGYGMAVLADIPANRYSLQVIVLLTFAAYNLNWFTDIEEDKENTPGRTSFVLNHFRVLQVASTVAYVGALLLSLRLGLEVVGFVVFPVVAVFVYGFDGFSRFSRVKDVFLMKNVFIGLVKTSSVFGIMVYPVTYSLDLAGGVAFVSVAFLTFCNSILFDIRDVDGDRTNSISTLPVVMGAERCRIAVSGSLIAFGAGIAISSVTGALPGRFWTVALASLYLACVVAVAGSISSNRYVSMLGAGGSSCSASSASSMGGAFRPGEAV